jgi:tRNA(fMet)-specific endonuclease VapC
MKLVSKYMKMIGSNILLDTNIVIAIFNGNRSYAEKITKATSFYLPSIVLGELYIGVNRVSNKAKHLKKITDLLTLCTIIDVDGVTAKYYGEIVALLYKKGKPIPTNDVWIAAMAIQYNLTLITKDAHFNEITNLQINSW